MQRAWYLVNTCLENSAEPARSEATASAIFARQISQVAGLFVKWLATGCQVSADPVGL